VPNDVKRRSELSAVWDVAQYGISRRLGFRAVWDFAPFGTQRRLGLSAVWDSAPFGTSLRLRDEMALAPRVLLARSLNALPSQNGNHHIKKKDEEWDQRRLDPEW
jgi:hypothetical protein